MRDYPRWVALGGVSVFGGEMSDILAWYMTADLTVLLVMLISYYLRESKERQ